MHLDLLRHLECPHCRAPLARVASGTGWALRCVRRHSFDLSRRGHVYLGVGRTPRGDLRAMVAARERFLATGAYDALSRGIAEAARRAAPETHRVLDVGAGTGRHLAAVLDALPGARGIALDASPHAIRIAAAAHPRICAIGADALGRLPLASRCVQLALIAFAPRPIDELARVLAPGGALIVATPTERHLHELIEELGLLRVEPRKRDRLAGRLAGAFAEISESIVESTLELGAAELAAIAAMGPSAHHARRGAPALSLRATATASFRIGGYRLR